MLFTVRMRVVCVVRMSLLPDVADAGQEIFKLTAFSVGLVYRVLLFRLNLPVGDD